MIRTFIYSLLAVTILLGFSLGALTYCTGTNQQTTSFWVAISAVLISTATLTSISFAVITYLETTVLHNRIEAAKAEVSTCRESFDKAMIEAQASLYQVASATMESLLECLMNSPDRDTLRTGLLGLQAAEVHIHLSSNTEEGLIKAMQLSLQLSKKGFLSLESEIWERSLKLTAESRRRVKKQYQSLKVALLHTIGD